MTRLTASALQRLAWLAFALSALVFVATVPLSLANHEDLLATSWAVGNVGELLLALMLFSFPVAGILINRKQPTNRIGWVLLLSGVVGTVGSAGDAYASYGLVTKPGSLPGAETVAALCAGDWVAPVGTIGVFLILLFPDGRLLSPRWRVVAWTAGITMVLLTVMLPMTPGALPDGSLPVPDNPLGVDALKPVLNLTNPLTFVLLACILASAASLVLRFRRSRGTERLQLKWLATAAAVGACMWAITETGTIVAGDADTPQSQLGWLTALQYSVYLSFILIPAAIGVAILKHGLYGIDVVINKTVVFGTLAAFITGVYVAIVVGVGAAVGQGDHSLALSITATALVAIAFQPVRERVQRVADRLVYGSRATPYEVLSDFAARMGGTYDSADLLPRMARTIGEGIGSARVQVWLRLGTVLAMEASWPAAQERPDALPVGADHLPELLGDRVVPVRHHGELLGAIVVSKAPGEPITPTEDKLLDDVASQAGLVLRNVRLIEELRNSRERLIRSQDDERRRLERNLHDGAQQSLVSVALLLRMTRARIKTRSSPAAAAIDEASRQLTTAIEELRELARGIHPAILTERGLGAAVASLADRSRVPVTVHCALTERPPASVEATVYFVIAEALTNVAKYAQASSVSVTVELCGATLVSTIVDDGIGGADATKGSGLGGLADRAMAVDGDLEVVSPPGQGTQLTCRIPVRARQQAVPGPDGAPAPVATFAVAGGQR